MSVLVNGWNLPKGCIYCPFFSGQGCKATMVLFSDLFNVATRPGNCPLKEYVEDPIYVVENPNDKCEDVSNG